MPTVSNPHAGRMFLTQSRRHAEALVGLAPLNKALSPSKLKFETLYISGIFVNF